MKLGPELSPNTCQVVTDGLGEIINDNDYVDDSYDFDDSDPKLLMALSDKLYHPLSMWPKVSRAPSPAPLFPPTVSDIALQNVKLPRLRAVASIPCVTVLRIAAGLAASKVC